MPVVDGLGFRNGSLPEISAVLCPNVSSMRSISACVQTSCSAADSASMGNLYSVEVTTDISVAWPFQRNLCRDFPTPSRSAYIRNLTIIMALLAAVFVLLRCYSRMVIVKRFWWDDWNTAVAALFMIMIAVVMIWGRSDDQRSLASQG